MKTYSGWSVTTRPLVLSDMLQYDNVTVRAKTSLVHTCKIDTLKIMTCLWKDITGL